MHAKWWRQRCFQRWKENNVVVAAKRCGLKPVYLMKGILQRENHQDAQRDGLPAIIGPSFTSTDNAQYGASWFTLVGFHKLTAEKEDFFIHFCSQQTGTAYELTTMHGL